jgi:predicted kinase
MRLVVMKGLAGSGKSTLAGAISRQLQWPLIDKDDVKDVLPETLSSAGAVAYEVMWQVTRRQLHQGLSVIADSPLSYPESFARAWSLAAETSATLAVIDCLCPDERVWQQRIDQRKSFNLPEHHQVDWERFQTMRAHQPPAYLISCPLLHVNTLRPLDELVLETCTWLLALPETDFADTP